MADINEARIWTDNAPGDMRVAKHLLSTMHPMPVEIIGFHSQQAAEKSLKAVLAYNETIIPRTHEITELINICKTLGACFDIPESVADTITEYAVKVRYKQETRDFTENDAKFAVKQAEKIINTVENYLIKGEQSPMWCRVLLTSSGFYSDGIPHTSIIKRFKDMLDKPLSETKVLFIPTAIKYPENELNSDEYIKMCLDELLILGVTAENIKSYDIDGSLSQQDAMMFDVIYFIGGDTSFLANRVKETDFDKIIMQMVFANKVYVGISAGSMLAMSNFLTPFNIEPEKDAFTGLGLVDIFFTVHCEPNTAPRTDLPRPHIPLTNQQAIVAKWNGYEVI